MKRVPSSEKTRQAIRALFEQGIDEGDPKSELMQMAMQLITFRIPFHPGLIENSPVPDFGTRSI
jgi:hypothetical protein